MGTTEHMVMVLFTLKKIILKSLWKLEAHGPWRTQDFRDRGEGGATPEVVAPIYHFGQFCPKMHGNEKKMDGRGGQPYLLFPWIRQWRPIKFINWKCSNVKAASDTKWMLVHGIPNGDCKNRPRMMATKGVAWMSSCLFKVCSPYCTCMPGYLFASFEEHTTKSTQ